MHKHTRMLVYDHGSDAHVEITEYADAPSSVSDPCVRSRIAPQGERAGAEVITEFGPAPVRPISYPKTLPFVPDRAVWTTESPSGVTPEGARWPCADPDALLEIVVSTSAADGWEVVPTPRRDQTLGVPNVVLRRDGILRELQVVSFGERSGFMLQMWDVPETLFHSPSA